MVYLVMCDTKITSLVDTTLDSDILRDETLPIVTNIESLTSVILGRRTVRDLGRKPEAKP